MQELVAPAEPTKSEPVALVEPTMVNPTTDDNKVKEIAIAKLKVFTGDRTKVRKFIQQCKIYLQINKDIFNADDKRITFILALMSEGEVAEWTEQFISSIQDDATDEMKFPTLGVFLKQLKEDFNKKMKKELLWPNLKNSDKERTKMSKN